ncbi:MAG TPA: carbohydrate ABC transporter permease, partial [Glaciihabitans sp.]|nr:carbohydrate ABC transporter permease [Glaciihabitans sp.]
MTTETVAAENVAIGPPPTKKDAPALRSSASYRSRGRIYSALKHLSLIVVSIVMVYPLIWLVVSSFKPNDQIFRNLSIFTTDLTIENYVNGWNDLSQSFGLFMVNSTILSVGAIIG